MKTIGYLYSALFCLFFLPLLSAQKKWVGLAQYGNFGHEHSGGMIWEVNTDGTNFNVLKNWAYPRIGSPSDNLVSGQDGKLYGWKLRLLNENVDGLSGISGAIFSMQPDGTDFQYLYVIDEPPVAGAMPTLLIRGNDENYYGAVTLGGQYNSGYIFKMAADGSDFTPIYQLPANTRMLSLLYGSNGQLIGGGKNTLLYNETIFSVNPDGSNYIVLNSSAQAQSICEGEDGKIYWLNGFRLMRMNLEGSWKTDLGPLYTGDDYHAYGGQLRRLPNGQLWGWIDYYFYIGCLDEGYGRLYFTLNNDGSLSNLKDQQYDYGDPVADEGNFIYSRNKKYDITNLDQSDLPEMDDCIRHLSAAGTDGWIYGRDKTQYYYWEAVDLNAYHPDDNVCRMVVHATKAGHLSKFCFEVPSVTSTKQNAGQAGLFLSPNPVQNTLQVSSGTQTTPDLGWQIHDAAGQLMLSGKVVNPHCEISVEKLPDGVYYLTLRGKSELISRMFIKAN
ncbi:MAG: T9SS C-terminal target domain-containing protein [Haliscomenobacteraceae bacterium CHB4]|nr:hypothetical protein [Saprospiraceae bacterium]MCE7925436.1 T9SS C-terminal target domain-containing protein [Haliscomenobacteraceae bacterium CHB4]